MTAPENPESGFFAALLQLVGAVFLQALLGLLGGEPLGATLEAVQQVLAGPLPDLVGFVHSVFSSFPRSGAGTQKNETFCLPHPAWNPKVSPFQTAAGQACPCIDAAAPQLLVAATPFLLGHHSLFLPGCQEAYTVFAGAFRLDEGRAAFYNKSIFTKENGRNDDEDRKCIGIKGC